MRIERDLARLTEPFDLIVIGGGITGVCVAREAAGRGVRTLLIEKDDFGGGTSAATSKYIHGGIRYLETYEFRVVRESLRERRILALAAPHLVRQTRFLMPAWSWSKPSAPVLGAGVAVYDLLSFDRNRNAPDSLKVPHPRWVRKQALLKAVPWLDPDGLHGAFAYTDTFNLHPERLLLAFLKSAVQAGAVALNHVQARGFVTAPIGGDDIAVLGVEVQDLLTDDRYTVKARTVVNAAGPWMDVVLRDLGRPVGVSVRRSKGVHLLTRPLGGDDTVFAVARSGKHVIVSPWQGYSFIGPTDTAIEAEPDDVRVEHGDVRQLLDTVNSTLAPGVAPLAEDDVEATTVGIRPLIVEEGVDSYNTSRRHELFDHAQTGVANLWSIGGGKWTTGRATGQETVEALLRSTALRDVAVRKFDSTTVAAGGAFSWAEDAEGYLQEAARSRPCLTLVPEVRAHLARLYGTEHERILDLVEHDPTLGRRLSDRPGRWDIAAQAVFAVTDEAARTLSDVLDRRLVLGTLGRLSREEIANVVEVVGPMLGWSEGAALAAIDVECARRAALEARLARRYVMRFSGKRTWVQERPAFYGIAGTGQPVLFLHGWALGQHTYRSVVERIASAGCRVYAPGLPGFGGTGDLPNASFSIAGYASWVNDFLDQLEIEEQLVVVGHSFGGGVAIRFTHAHTARVRSLVLVNSVGGSTWQKGRALRSISERPLWDWGIHFPGDVWPLRQASRVLPVIFEDFVPNLIRNPRAMIRVANLARRADLRSELEELRASGMPITALWATRDGIIPRESFEALCVAAGVEGTVVEGTHSWLLADPDQFGEVMTNVLQVANAARELEQLAKDVADDAPPSRARRILKKITPG